MTCEASLTMQLTIQHPHNGWLPVLMTIAGHRLEFRASNVLNDPLSELLAMALWLVAPESPPLETPRDLNLPYSDENIRGVHFWLEPAWHTLLILRVANHPDVQVRFYKNHHGGLTIGPNEFNTSERTLFDQCSSSSFASNIDRSLADVCRALDGESFQRHWGRPFPESDFRRLSDTLTRSLSAPQ